MNENATTAPIKARLANLDELCTTLLPGYLSPVPSRDSIRRWLNAERVPRFKMNPNASRGGGPAFYSVVHVERLLRERTVFVPPSLGSIGPARVLGTPE
jgi:hypothetical protein